MAGVFKRIFRVMRSAGGAYQARLNRFIRFDDNIFDKTNFGFQSGSDAFEETETNQTSWTDAIPKQVREDLALFGLTPPASFDEIRQARNREVKKYHPDKHAIDPEKYQTAQEIMQMLNTAFDRLKTYYES